MKNIPKIASFKHPGTAIIVDAIIIVSAYLLTTLAFVFQGAPRSYYLDSLIFMPIAILVHCLLNHRFGLYRFVDRHVGVREAFSAVKASTMAIAILIIISLALIYLIGNQAGYQALVLIPIGGMMVLILSCGVRLYPRALYRRPRGEAGSQANLLIVGAGDAGEQIVRIIQKDPLANTKAVALVDDDPRLIGKEIRGIFIYGPIENIPGIVEKKRVDEILIAIPSATFKQFQRIWLICSRTGVPLKTLGSLQNIHNGKVGVRQIRDIQVEDVLSREPVQTDYDQIRQFLRGKTVAVTGAGGSIGSELVARISRSGPSRIILIDQDETALYHVHEELEKSHFLDHEIFVADVKSERKMRSVFLRTRPDIVFHAAAYKHVPLMEMHPDMSVLNNVWGTLNVATISGEIGVQSFVNISSDKAVEPANIMGATKRLCECLVAELNDIYPETRYCSVRFGNVLGSRGSVIPIFRQQILDGGPVTITDPHMTRYFMMISEAVDLVLQAAAFEDANAIYVLDMGEPVKITNLARQMIDFYEPGKAVEIVFTGLRPGEKLHERLFDDDELPEASGHEKIYRVNTMSWGQFRILAMLPLLFEKARAEDKEAIRGLLADWIPTYKSFDVSKIGRIAAAAGEDVGGEAPWVPVANNLNYSWSIMEAECDRPLACALKNDPPFSG